MKKRSILHLISSSSFLGAERVITELCRYGDSNFFSIHVIVLSSDKNLEGIFRNAIGHLGVPVSLLPCDKPFDIATISKIGKYVGANNIVLIHSHGYKADFYSYFISMFKNKNLLLFSTVHTWKLNTFSERMYKIIDKLILRKFGHVVTVSLELCEELDRSGFNNEMVDYIPNGVDVDSFVNVSNHKNPRSDFGVRSTDFVVGCVASLTSEKAQEYLIEAASLLLPEFPELRVVLIGDGGRRSYLENYAGALHVSDFIIFTGYRNDVRELYAGLDVFALVSKYEGLPMALLEAMAAGVPVVASAVGAIPDVVGDNEFGLLVRSGSAADIVDSVRSLITDNSLRNKLSLKGRSRVEEKFSSKKMCRAYECLYKKLINSENGK